MTYRYAFQTLLLWSLVLALSFLSPTTLTLSALLFTVPTASSAETQTAWDADSNPDAPTKRFMALLKEARPGETRHEVALRVDQITMAVGGDVATHLLFAEDPNEDWSVPAQYPIDYIFTLEIPKMVDVATQLDAVAETFNLAWIEPDAIAVGAGQRHEEDGQHYLSLEDLRSTELLRSQESVTVAVIDTGINLSHPALSSRMVEGFNFLTDTADPQDDHGQGTSVAGIISAQDTTEGSDPVIRLMPLKVLDQTNRGFYSDSIRAIRYAVDRGAQVINLGIGGQDESRALREVLRYAAERGVVVVSPMMNDGGDTVYYPAAYPETISVGAVDGEARRFSNYGDHVEVVAYGDNILTTDLMIDSHYSLWGGSSNANAIVSGLVALLKAQSPSLSMAQIKDILQRTARDQIGDPSEDTSGWDPFYGYGMVDAPEATTTAQSIAGSNHTDNSDKRHASTAATSQRKAVREAGRSEGRTSTAISPRGRTGEATLPQDDNPFEALSSSASGSVQLAWNPPTTNADGTPLKDLAGYKVHYGQSSRKYTSVINVGNQTTYTVSSLTSGQTYYFAVTAYDTSSNESAFSNEVKATVGGSTKEQQLASLATLLRHSNNFRSDHTPGHLFDGCTQGTAACTAGNEDINSFWLEFDFGAVKNLTRARLFGDNVGTWLSKSWSLQYKNNATDPWQTAFSGSNALGNTWFERSLAGIGARFVRVEVFGNTAYSPGKTQARELEIYGN